MRDVWGLIVALTGLFIVWLWATGRAKAMWQAAVTATNAPTTQTTNVSQPVTINPYSAVGTGGSNYPNLLQISPYQFNVNNTGVNIPTYVPTVGNLSMGIP